jgi:hypothetical protein
MSQTKTYEIRCPKCGHEQSVELYEAVNVQQSPELKSLLLSNQLNAVVCAECHASFRVDKPLLYNDPKYKRMIYLIPMSEGAAEIGERQFTDSLRQLNGALPKGVEAPEVCLVLSRMELVERVFLFDAGLNERVIEYMKHMIYTRNLEKLHPANKALLFNAQDSTEKALCFVVQDVKTRKLEAMLQYDRATYTALSEMFDRDEQTPTLLELFPGPHVSARALLLKELEGSKAAETPPPA